MLRHKPNLLEIFRTDTSTVESAIAHLLVALKPVNINWNYIDGNKRIMHAYNGLHSLGALTSALRGAQESDGFKYNKEITELAAPLAFGRSTQVIPMKPRSFVYAGDRSAAFRIPFFFLENKTVFAYCLQPRKGGRMNANQIGGYASIIKKYLLDTEFLDEKTELEFVDVGCPIGSKTRAATTYSLCELDLWSDQRLDRHFSVVVEALNFIENSHLIERVRRPHRDASMPLFGDM